uniref:Coiled-coil-helix-coiled-coil-helix domain containing 10 n=1 Tax=Microcebus murinus TaxID=30608 RepID=A0A8C5W2I7_MICMU
MPRGSRSAAARPARPLLTLPPSPCRWGGPVPTRSSSSWSARPLRVTCPCVRASARS